MSTQDLTYSTPEPDEQAQMEALLAQALQFAPDYLHWWVEQIGLPNFRVLRRHGRVVAGVGLIDMAQWFMGRAVPLVGITAVGVALEQRGRGVGAALMRQMLAEIQASGVPLAALHPSSLAFYRSVGFERAGSRITYEAPLYSFAGRPTLEVEQVTADALPALTAIYKRYAARTHGALERPPFIWARALTPPTPPVTAYRIGPAAAPEGYVVLAQSGRDEPLRIHDMCLLSAAAGRAAQTLVAGQRTMADRVAWNGAPDDLLALLAADRPPAVTRMHDWMLRVVDAPAALAGRGYPAMLSGELHIELRDAVLQRNAGRFILAVADSAAEVRPGGRGSLRLDVRDLAALYSGHIGPALLQVIGTLDGDAEALALAAALFGAERPRMAEMF